MPIHPQRVCFHLQRALRRYYELQQRDQRVIISRQTYIVPLCDRLPTPGPTPTATPMPPYPAPNLLLPASGSSLGPTLETVTLQWASVANLRANEKYRVTIQDLTSTEENPG